MNGARICVAISLSLSFSVCWLCISVGIDGHASAGARSDGGSTCYVIAVTGNLEKRGCVWMYWECGCLVGIFGEANFTAVMNLDFSGLLWIRCSVYHLNGDCKLCVVCEGRGLGLLEI